jgi:hypothetical protein
MKIPAVFCALLLLSGLGHTAKAADPQPASAKPASAASIQKSTVADSR